MKICVIHGSPRRGNTYRATEIIKEEMLNKSDIQFTEFFLPNDMPYFCCGCYACIEIDENKCPHTQHVQPIVKAMREADGIILTSPVYVLAESGGMKAFLDHLAYMFIVHRPMPEMFSKVGMVISTTAGAGTGFAIRTIKRSLSFWGVKRIYKCGLAIPAKNWDAMKEEKKQKHEKILKNKADKFYKGVKNRNGMSYRMFTRIIFKIMKSMISKFHNENIDKKYWIQKGWLNGKNTPF